MPAQCVVDLSEAYTLSGNEFMSCLQCFVPKSQMNEQGEYLSRSSEAYKDRLMDAMESENGAAVYQICQMYNINPIKVFHTLR